MSLDLSREQIATTLSTVDGIKGHKIQPRAPRAGDAWPLYRGSERDDDTGMWWHKFAIGVMLPQDEPAADTFIDAHLELISDALEKDDVGYIDEAEPANFGTDTSPVYGLLITMRGD